MNGLLCMGTGFRAASVGHSRNKCRQWLKRLGDDPIETIHPKSALVQTRKLASEPPFVTVANPPDNLLRGSTELPLTDSPTRESIDP
ncbi:hypothetical protein Pla100_56670 [Neorhodopirellula pilleata]|uniref:Uncharacterized protein n=1 Tax=Neorhodopirellula pilleata TaxID=2714738 RepID=A0A5C5ZP18_9BACT|nr:hypothetical protein Pla100_56670 [Neorhodopirellula pilleata]